MFGGRKQAESPVCGDGSGSKVRYKDTTLRVQVLGSMGRRQGELLFFI